MTDNKQALVTATYAKYGVFALDKNLLTMFDSLLKFEEPEDVKCPSGEYASISLHFYSAGFML